MRHNAGMQPSDTTTSSPKVGIGAVAQRGNVADLAALCRDGAAVLTGAGISTASGIPDYRGVTGRARPANPMSHHDFVSSTTNRQRYWARSMVGWSSIDATHPNDAHRAVADLQRRGHLATIITQNVDGLHQAAGADDVVELHGTLAVVRCLHCGLEVERPWLQSELARVNPSWVDRTGITSADGDAHVADVDGFVVVDCPRCGGVLMPKVVFFGAGVPRDVVAHCYDVVERAPALIVLGTSLHVWSGLRFVRHAARHDRPVAIVNHGPTRADKLASVRLDADLPPVMAEVMRRIDARKGNGGIDVATDTGTGIGTGSGSDEVEAPRPAVHE